MRRNLSATGRFRAGVNPLGGDEELNVVNIGNFGRVHHTQYEPENQPKSTA